jgi:hypothetical protein
MVAADQAMPDAGRYRQVLPMANRERRQKRCDSSGQLAGGGSRLRELMPVITGAGVARACCFHEPLAMVWRAISIAGTSVYSGPVTGSCARRRLLTIWHIGRSARLAQYIDDEAPS